MTTPIVSLATVQQTIARALSIAPADRARIEKAATLISFGHVSQSDATTFSVKSLTDATVSYRVRPDACDCLGRVHFPTRRCSHEWAARIVLSAEQTQQTQAEQASRQRSGADRVALVFASANRRAA